MDAVRLVLGKRGHWTVRVESGQMRYLHSQHDPYSEARRLVESWGQCDGFDAVIFGLGLGYHVSEFVKLNPDCIHIEVLEPRPQLLEWARQVTPHVFANPCVSVHCLGEDGFLRRLHGVSIEKVFLHPATVESLPPSELRSLLQELMMLQASERRYRRQLIDNLRQNASRIHDGNILTGRRGMWSGRPGVLAAAGPSLLNALGFLDAISRRGGIILSVSRVLHLLLQRGIRPFGCVMSEGSDKGLEHWKDLHRYLPVPTLYALPTASSVAVASYPGEVVFVLQKGHEQAEEMAAALGADLFLTGGSVSTLALDLLHYFGCDPIIFAGLDLAYVDGKSHADSGTRQSVTRSYTVEVASVTGDKVLSTVSWQSFRRWIEQYISSHPDRTYINVSGGAHIQGTHLMTYGEALGRCGGNAMMYSESQNLQGSGQ